MTTTPLVIIGAGPAGLGLGYELSRRSIPFIILEAGRQPGNSWATMPTRMRLLTPWCYNRLPGSYDLRVPRFAYVDRARFVSYLNDYASFHSLPLETECRVKGVRLTDQGFELQTSQGDVRCKTLVNATGYFANPFQPRYPGDESSRILRLHASEYADPENLRERLGLERPRVLVVGQRLSAGQLLVELQDGGAHVTLSARSPLRFGRDPRLVERVMPAYYPLLRFYDRLSANHRGNSDHEMQGGRTEELITTGVVSVRPGIRLLRDESVEFVDGQRDPFDAVIYATGYRPALNHMREVVNELVRRRRGGLHFLGLDNLRNVRSRFLVGIREDAALLAQRLDV